jgi:hypothetical protein
VAVMALTEISGRVGPAWGGILSGFPLGTGIMVYFISREQGLAFMIQGIPWGIAGLSASLIFCTAYLWIALKINRRFLSILMASIISFLLFLGAGLLISNLKLNLLFALICFLATFSGNMILVRKMVSWMTVMNKRKSSLITIIIRGIAAGIIILLTTGLAAVFGSKWSGIFSAFPATLYPLIIILHIESGHKMFPLVIREFSFSISTLAVFFISCFIALPVFGLNRGFLLVYAICLLYLYMISKFRKKNLKT